MGISRAELRESFEEWMASLDGRPSTEAFAGALKDAFQKGYQEIFNRGHSTATAQAEEEKATLETKLESTREKLQDAEAKVRKLEGDQPDVSKIHSEYEDKIEALKSEHERQVEELNAKVQKNQEQFARAQLKSRLAGKLDPDYADVKVEKAMDRVKFDGEEVTVLEKGTEIPVQTDGDRDPLDYLADELVEESPGKFVLVDVDTGGGVDRGSGGGGRNGDRWKRYQEEAEESRQAPEGQSISLEEAMSGKVDSD